MNKNKEKLKRLIKIAAILILTVSLYFAGMIQYGIKTLSMSFNPIKHIQCMAEYGFPTVPFLLLALAFSCIIGYSLYTEWQRLRHSDKMGRNVTLASERQPYGEVHFEEPQEYEDVALVQPPERAYGTILGQLDNTGTKLVNFKMANNRQSYHIAAFSPSGGGKTFTFTKPYCFQAVKRRESVIITDPDGGLRRDMAHYFEDNGYIVRTLDLTNNMRWSDGWDCLKSIQPESAEVDALIFAQTVMENVVDDMTSIYATGPMSLLKAVILYVLLDPCRTPAEKNIAAVYDIIQNPGGEAFLDSIFDPAILSRAQRPALKPYMTFKTASPNLRGNLITNLTANLQLLQSERVSEVLSTDDIDLVLPGKQPCAYFCIFPDSHNTFQFIVALFFSMIFRTLISFADLQPNGMLPVPVNFLLDEFASIGKLPDWSQKMATMRKRRMNAVMIFQDITQLQNLYEKNWENILSNCSTWLCIACNSGTTAQLMSRRIGKTTIKVETHQHPASESIFTNHHSHSEGEGQRDLMAYNEMFTLGMDDVLLLFQWHNPIWLKKYPFTLHPDSRKLRPMLRDEIPDWTDQAGRALKRIEEEKRVAAYLKEHPLEELDRSYANPVEAERKGTPADRVKSGLRKIFEQSRGLLSRSCRAGDKITECQSEFDVNELEITNELVVVPTELQQRTPELELCDAEIFFETQNHNGNEMPDSNPDTAGEAKARPREAAVSKMQIATSVSRTAEARYRFISEDEETQTQSTPPGKRSEAASKSRQ